jgi:hypothetical protein
MKELALLWMNVNGAALVVANFQRRSATIPR